MWRESTYVKVKICGIREFGCLWRRANVVKARYREREGRVVILG